MLEACRDILSLCHSSCFGNQSNLFGSICYLDHQDGGSLLFLSTYFLLLFVFAMNITILVLSSALYATQDFVMSEESKFNR